MNTTTNSITTKMTIGAATIFAAAAPALNAASITIPNGSFETIYKPGSTSVTADVGGGWTNGVGSGTPMNGTQTAAYSDGSSGGSVDVPGWINTPGIPTAYDWAVGSGSIAAQNETSDGVAYFTANGGAWGNPQGASIESAASLGTIEGGLSYTLAMSVNGPVSPVFLELLADGVALTPTSSLDPAAPHAWDDVSRTFDAASLAGNVGQELTIRLGWGPEAAGAQSQIDNVTLNSASAIPEPSSIALLLLGSVALIRRRRA